MSNVTQQVAELAVQQNLANVEVLSTQQIVEVLLFSGAVLTSRVNQGVAEIAVKQNSEHVDVFNTQQVVEVLIGPIVIIEPAYDNFLAQPISVMS